MAFYYPEVYFGPICDALVSDQDITDRSRRAINIDEIGYNGDLIEAEAFAYLAIRSIKKLALSTPQTTGVKRSTTGGILN